MADRHRPAEKTAGAGAAGTAASAPAQIRKEKKNRYS